jgi:hypothetical protein
VEGGSGPSLVDGKNNSRDPELRDTEQSTLDDHLDLANNDASSRYDCRRIYANMEMEAEDGQTEGFRCGSWDCYCCAHRMRMNLIEDMERLVKERPEMRRLLTITLGEQGPEGPEGHEYLTKRFNALRTSINDRYDDLSYVWVRHEGDENGRPHIHLLVDRYLPQDELSMLSERAGLGEVLDIRRVNARNAAKYLTSYLGKGALANLPKGLRRYGSSQDIDLDVRGAGGDDDDRDWDLMMDDLLVTTEEGEPLRRGVTPVDFVQQREWSGPVPPD